MARQLRHVVMFGFKPEATPEDIEGVVARFAALKGLVPGVEALEWGRDVSPEGLSQGHSHAFTLTFATDAARDAYLPHPAHQAFVASIGPYVARALVVDYWAETV